MTLFFYYGSGDLGNSAVRMGDGFSFQEAAEAGTYAMSRVRIDDPTGALDLVGHHAFSARDYACSWDSVFRGYFADREVGRVDSLLTGAARFWDCTVYDLNAALEFEVIRGSSGKRPAETDTQRLAWVLASGYTGPISSDASSVFGAGVNLDKADYRGQKLSDVLYDCATASGCNYWVAWEDSLGAPVLHYYLPTRAYNTSTLKISNVLADVDGSTVFAPDKDARLGLDPSRVYSGVYWEYGEHAAAEYRTDAGVLAAIGHKRETAQQDASVRTASKADTKADKWLGEASTELATVRVTLRKVPPAQVNLIRPGQRIQVKFTHLPNLTSYTYMRVTRRTVAQDGDTQLFYRLELELANPKMGGGVHRHKAKPVAPDLDDGSAVTLTRAALTAGLDMDDGHGGIPDSITYTNVVPPGPRSIVEGGGLYATTYIYGNCPFGQSAYNGLSHQEQWLEFNPGTLVGQAAVKITYATSVLEGILNPASPGYQSGACLEYGVLSSGPPTTYGQGTVLGECSAGGGTFSIPAGLLTPSATNYVFLRAAWQGVEGGCCSGELVAGLLGPLGDSGTVGGGEFNSGALIVDPFTAVLRSLSGSGLTPWITPAGTVNGTNKVFTLTGWDGTGIPRIRIGAVEYAAGTEFTYDADALTVTMDQAPWVGSNIQGRWHV